MKTSPASRALLEQMGLRLEPAGNGELLTWAGEVAMLLTSAVCIWLALAATEDLLPWRDMSVAGRVVAGLTGIATLGAFVGSRRRRVKS